MKKTTLYFTGFFAVCTLLFTACSKNNDPKPDIDDTENPTNTITAEQLRENIIGKWTIEGNGLNIAPSSIKPRLTASAHNRLTSNIIAGTNGTAATSAFIEFLEDGTFIILDSNGNVSTGDYTAKDGQTIDLSGFGSIKDIKFDADNINFVIYFDNKTLTIKAKKSAVIPASDKTTLLCRTWELEHRIKGWDEIPTAGVTKSLLTFSKSGTFLARFYNNKGEVVMTATEYWKWHPTDANRIWNWSADWAEEIEATDKYDDFAVSISVLQLTQTKFEMTTRDNGVVTHHLIFKAAN